jgi:hypothetical protein
LDDTAPTLTARDVPARQLAVPSTASPELQQLISTLTVRGALTDRPTLRTVSEWKALIAQADTGTLAFIPGLDERFPHIVVRGLIAGVAVREIAPTTLDPALRL